MLDFIHKKTSPEPSDYESSEKKPLRKSMIGSLTNSCYSRGGVDSLSRKSKFLHNKYSMYEGGDEKSRSISRGSSKKSKVS